MAKKSNKKNKNIKNRNLNNNSIPKKAKIDNNMFDILEEDNKKSSNSKIIITLVIVIFLCIISNVYTLFIYKTHPKIKEKVKIVEKYKIPENIVFLGDSITEYYDVNKYFSNNRVVNSGISGNITDDILKNMEERVYQYNPSKIFLLIGTNDLTHKKDNKEIISDIEEIIEKIKENRPETKIYVESIYPVNDEDNEKINHNMVSKRKNEDIKEINSQIKKYCEKNNIEYIDLYDKLCDKDGNLKLEYTNEGLHISDEGYKFITKELEKYIK